MNKRPKQSSTTAAGTSFELEVAQQYRDLGYRVTHNVSLRERQVDLLVEKEVAGAAPLRLIVDAKVRGRTLGANDVNQFENLVTAAVSALAVTGGVIITDRAISKNARGIVRESPRLRVMLLDELREEALVGAAALSRAVESGGPLQGLPYYVETAGTRYASDLENGTRVNDVVKFVGTWAISNTSLLILLGDFGSGKTTLIEKLFAEIARRRLAERRNRYPILLRLRSLRQHPTLWDFIDSSLRENQYLGVSRDIFFDQLRAGNFLVLMDGFDEILTSATVEDRARYLGILYPLISSPSPCVLSSRPTYFESPGQLVNALNRHIPKAPVIERVPDHDDNDYVLTAKLLKVGEALGLGFGQGPVPEDFSTIVQIEAFDDGRIQKYFENRAADLKATAQLTPAAITKRLHAIYDVQDLLTRPQQLTLIFELIVKGAIDLAKQNPGFGPAMLYETATQLAARREETKRQDGKSLTTKERLEVSRQLAMAMLAAGRVELNPTDIQRAVFQVDLPSRSKIEADEEATLERILTEVRLCTFLVFAPNGQFRFGHQSYFDFFVAQHAYLSVVHSTEGFAQLPFEKIGRDIIYFLASYAKAKVTFRRRLSHLLVGSVKRQSHKNFAARVLFGAGELSNHALSELSIFDVGGRRLKLENLAMKKVSLSGVQLQHSRLKNWVLEDSIVSQSSFADTRIDHSTLTLRVAQTSFDKVTFSNTTLSIQGADWSIRDCSFVSCTLLLSRGTLSGSKFTDCHLSWQKDQPSQSRRSDSVGLVVVGGSLRGPLIERWLSSEQGSLQEGIIRGSLLAGFLLTEYEFEQLASTGVPDSDVLQVQDCSGIIVTPKAISRLTPGQQAMVRSRNPKAAYVSQDALKAWLQDLSSKKGKARRSAALPRLDNLLLRAQNAKNEEIAEMLTALKSADWLAEPAFEEWRKFIAP